jgi:signal transduction histidine kinase
VQCDRGRVLQVLGNLLGNAIKFASAGGSVEVRVVAADAMVVVSVTDDGPGILPDELPRVFERNWQSRRTANLGKGLGLAIAKALVEAHGGSLWVTSEPGTGTTFSFTLPERRPS